METPRFLSEIFPQDQADLSWIKKIPHEHTCQGTGKVEKNSMATNHWVRDRTSSSYWITSRPSDINRCRKIARKLEDKILPNIMKDLNARSRGLKYMWRYSHKEGGKEGEMLDEVEGVTKDLVHGGILLIFRRESAPVGAGKLLVYHALATHELDLYFCKGHSRAADLEIHQGLP
ncbi:hypothetical protein E2562_039166 [Oryza meyeriana var. granulata]|uniref:Uncharacterized protein n=1 Tax=Oryza meyeriana var. granulata TaxID=110450 RepID=A0A6G1CMJ3_9ORYZ|nr:hypothetical protein E2562_039166 [Oryza meyeriana var. granulata]